MPYNYLFIFNSNQLSIHQTSSTLAPFISADPYCSVLNYIVVYIVAYSSNIVLVTGTAGVGSSKCQAGYRLHGTGSQLVTCSCTGDVGGSQSVKPLGPKSIIVARHDLLYFFLVHHLDQPLAAAHVVTDGAVGQPVDHWAVIDHISTKQYFVVLVMEADAASGVAWHVEHRQLPVPEVDDIAWKNKTKTKREEQQSTASDMRLQCSTDTAQAALTRAQIIRGNGNQVM